MDAGLLKSVSRLWLFVFVRAIVCAFWLGCGGCCERAERTRRALSATAALPHQEEPPYDGKINVRVIVQKVGRVYTNPARQSSTRSLYDFVLPFTDPSSTNATRLARQLLKEHLQGEGQWLTRYGDAPEPTPGAGAGVIGGDRDGDVGFMGVEAMTR